MDLTEQKITGINEIHLLDSLNTSLLEAKIKIESSTTVPNSNDLIIYVDKATSTNQTVDRKQYVFNLNKPLNYLNQVSDEFLVQIKFNNNDVVMETIVKRLIGSNETGNYLLTEEEVEELESFPITLFEGENYIYTNYLNADIEIIYPKDNDLNNQYLNNAIYFGHKLNNSSEFSLDDIYFKDAFTKTGEELNLEVNSVSLDCITSKNNKFSLDSEGNLIVNSIVSAKNPSDNQSICDLIYPVGSIYLSVNDVTPSNLFGGAWEQIKDKFLLSAGDTYLNATTGGSATHTLTVAELPNFTPSGSVNINSSSTSIGVDHDAGYGSSGFSVHGWTNKSGQQYTFDLGSHGHSASFTGNSIGSGSSHSIMPPYLTVYMWKRVA